MAPSVKEQHIVAQSMEAQSNAAFVIVDRSGCRRYMDDNAVACLQWEWPRWSPPMLRPRLLECLGTRWHTRWVGKRVYAQLFVLAHLSLNQPQQPRRDAALTWATLDEAQPVT